MQSKLTFPEDLVNKQVEQNTLASVRTKIHINLMKALKIQLDYNIVKLISLMLIRL